MREVPEIVSDRQESAWHLEPSRPAARRFRHALAASPARLPALAGLGLGEPAAAGGHRLPARGEPDPPRHARSPTATPYRRPAPPPGCERHRSRPRPPGGCVWGRDTRHDPARYRRLVAQKYDGSHTRRPGRPSTKPDIAAMVVRMANENPTWGYTRIRGGLKSLGHEVARNTIKAILKDHGIAPARSAARTLRGRRFSPLIWTVSRQPTRSPSRC